MLDSIVAFIVPVVVIVLVLAVLAANIRVVQQSRAFVIERLGAFSTVWEVGLHVKVPFVERVAKRVSVGLARLGSYIGHGSGEVFVAFSTANPYDHRVKENLRTVTAFREDSMDLPFQAAAECAEEAVLNCLFTARTVTGFQGKTIRALTDLWTPEAGFQKGE